MRGDAWKDVGGRADWASGWDEDVLYAGALEGLAGERAEIVAYLHGPRVLELPLG